MSVHSDAPWRVVSARTGLRQQLRDIWAYREFLVLSVRTQLKVKYKNSTLGFMWSMLNPALYLVVYYIAGSSVPLMKDLSNIWNMAIGFGIMLLGLLMAVRWR